MLKLCRVTKVKLLFLLLIYVFYCDLFEFLAAILDKGLLFRLQGKQNMTAQQQGRLNLEVSSLVCDRQSWRDILRV